MNERASERKPTPPDGGQKQGRIEQTRAEVESRKLGKLGKLGS